MHRTPFIETSYRTTILGLPVWQAVLAAVSGIVVWNIMAGLFVVGRLVVSIVIAYLVMSATGGIAERLPPGAIPAFAEFVLSQRAEYDETADIAAAVPVCLDAELLERGAQDVQW